MFLHDFLTFVRKPVKPLHPDDVLVHWDESLSVGNGLIDNEHREIIDILNRLYRDWSDDRNQLNIVRELERLRITVASHFENEEEVLARHHCPVLSAHAAEHQRLLAELNDLAKQSGRISAARLETRLLQFIRKLVLGHVLVWDMDVREYLRT